jgi:uncharacterized Tic20 family protein
MVQYPSDATEPTTPPGWYPTGDGWQQYWDGYQWTEHRAPLHPQTQTQSPSAGNDNNMALFVHLGGALLGILVPIVMYIAKKDESPFVRHHSLEALNFHITVWIASVVSLVLILVVIGIFMLIAIVIGFYVLSVVAAIAASRGEWYRYPMTIRIFT